MSTEAFSITTSSIFHFHQRILPLPNLKEYFQKIFFLIFHRTDNAMTGSKSVARANYAPFQRISIRSFSTWESGRVWSGLFVLSAIRRMIFQQRFLLESLHNNPQYTIMYKNTAPHTLNLSRESNVNECTSNTTTILFNIILSIHNITNTKNVKKMRKQEKKPQTNQTWNRRTNNNTSKTAEAWWKVQVQLFFLNSWRVSKSENKQAKQIKHT